MVNRIALVITIIGFALLAAGGYLIWSRHISPNPLPNGGGKHGGGSGGGKNGGAEVYLAEVTGVPWPPTGGMWFLSQYGSWVYNTLGTAQLATTSQVQNALASGLNSTGDCLRFRDTQLKLYSLSCNNPSKGQLSSYNTFAFWGKKPTKGTTKIGNFNVVNIYPFNYQKYSQYSS